MSYKSIFETEPKKEGGYKSIHEAETPKNTGYKSIFDTGEEKVEEKIEEPKVAPTGANKYGEGISGLPDFLGGGRYHSGKPGELALEERGYAGIEAPGQYREHIFPVSLGGTSNLDGDNINVVSKEMGKSKGSFEGAVIKRYQRGDISLPEARMEVLDKWRRVTGLVPKQGVGSYIGGELLDVAKHPIKSLKDAFGFGGDEGGEELRGEITDEGRKYISSLNKKEDVNDGALRGEMTDEGRKYISSFEPEKKINESLAAKSTKFIKPTEEDFKPSELAKLNSGKQAMSKYGELSFINEDGEISSVDAIGGVGTLEKVGSKITKKVLDKGAVADELVEWVYGKLNKLGEVEALTPEKTKEAIGYMEKIEASEGLPNGKDISEAYKFLLKEKVTPPAHFDDLFPNKPVKSNVIDDVIPEQILDEPLPIKTKPVDVPTPKTPKPSLPILKKIENVIPRTVKEAVKNIAPIKSQDSKVKRVFKNWNREVLLAEEQANKKLNVVGKTSDGTPSNLLKFEKGEPTSGGAVIRKEFDALYRKANESGLELGYVPNYVPQVYDNTMKEVKEAMSKFMKDSGVDPKLIDDYLEGIKELPKNQSKSLKLNPSFSKERAFPDYDTAIKYKLTPKYNELNQLLAHYDAELGKTISNKKFIESLTRMGKIATPETAPKHWVPLTVPFSPKGAYAEPELAKMLNGMFRDEDLLGLAEAGTKAFSNVAKGAQTIQLSAGVPSSTVNYFAIGIGLVKELTAGNYKAAVNFIRANSTPKTIKYFNKHAKYFEMMAEEGLNFTNRAGNYKSIYSNLKNTKGLGKKLGFAWDQTFNEKTFNNLLPMNQLDVFKDTYEKALKKGKTEEQAKKLAGDTLKAFSGLYENVGRGRGTEDVLSSVFFAPAFREGIINTLLNTGKSVTTQMFNPAFKQNRKLLAGMIISYGGYNALNKKLTGHYMWENPAGHEFDLMIPTELGEDQDDVIYTPFMPSFLAFARNTASGTLALGTGDTDTAKQKLGSLFSTPVKLATEISANRDYFGRKIYDEDASRKEKSKAISAYVGLSVNHPFIRETVRQATTDKALYQSLSEAMELPLKFSSYTKIENQQFYTMLDEMKKKKAKALDSVRPRYKEIKKLLIKGDINQANILVNKLNNSDYELYKTLKRADKERDGLDEEVEVFEKYKEVTELMKNGETEKATDIVQRMSDEEYLAYTRLKNKLQ